MKIKPYHIHTIDLHFQQVPGTIASYLIEGPQGYVLVETGPGSCLPAMHTALDNLGISPEMIADVFVTHIHFDHAGAAGWWSRQGARVYVHYFGARYLVDPEKLIASATRIYGNQMEPLWGEILPATEANIIPVYDGDRIEAAGLTFTGVETPGHARNHHVYELDNVAFTGDAAGIYLPQYGMSDLPTPPPEFNREQWEQTLDLLLDKEYDQIYPTHFGRVTAVTPHLQNARRLLHDFTGFVGEKMDAGMEREPLIAAFIAWNHQRGRDAGLNDAALAEFDLVNPPFMTVDGIMRYWRKRGQK